MENLDQYENQCLVKNDISLIWLSCEGCLPSSIECSDDCDEIVSDTGKGDGNSSHQATPTGTAENKYLDHCIIPEKPYACFF